MGRIAETSAGGCEGTAGPVSFAGCVCLQPQFSGRSEIEGRTHREGFCLRLLKSPARSGPVKRGVGVALAVCQRFFRLTRILPLNGAAASVRAICREFLVPEGARIAWGVVACAGLDWPRVAP